MILLSDSILLKNLELKRGTVTSKCAPDVDGCSAYPGTSQFLGVLAYSSVFKRQTVVYGYRSSNKCHKR